MTPVVIPGRTESANPESSNEIGTCIRIPGPLASRVSRNDGSEI
jgi:hypothetical protein